MRASPATPPTAPPTTAGVAGLEPPPPPDAAVVDEVGAATVPEAEIPPPPTVPVLEAPAALLPDAPAPEVADKVLVDVTDPVPKIPVPWPEWLDVIDPVDVAVEELLGFEIVTAVPLLSKETFRVDVRVMVVVMSSDVDTVVELSGARDALEVMPGGSEDPVSEELNVGTELDIEPVGDVSVPVLDSEVINADAEPGVTVSTPIDANETTVASVA